jgi:hypothetical protein
VAFLWSCTGWIYVLFIGTYGWRLRMEIPSLEMNIRCTMDFTYFAPILLVALNREIKISKIRTKQCTCALENSKTGPFTINQMEID